MSSSFQVRIVTRMTVRELADLLDEPVVEVMRSLAKQGVLRRDNEIVELEFARRVALDMGYSLDPDALPTAEELAAAEKKTDRRSTTPTRPTREQVRSVKKKRITIDCDVSVEQLAGLLGLDWRQMRDLLREKGIRYIRGEIINFRIARQLALELGVPMRPSRDSGSDEQSAAVPKIPKIPPDDTSIAMQEPEPEKDDEEN